MIRVKGLKKAFGDHLVLKGIDYEIKKGEKIVVVGPSGSGKSTFLRCLNLLEKPTEGEIWFEDQLITDPKVKLDEIREQMGMVFQQFNLFNNLTILKNITLAPVKLKLMSKEEADEKAFQLLDRIGLRDKADAYPSQLSGGQKQRVAIAGIIAMQPDCIVLDEPTAMLDPRGRAEVMKTIRRLNREKGITIVLITHFMDEAARAGRVVVMDNGEILMDGAPHTVFSKVEELKRVGLDVPQAAELADELRREGWALPPDILTVEECVDALASQISDT